MTEGTEAGGHAAEPTMPPAIQVPDVAGLAPSGSEGGKRASVATVESLLQLFAEMDPYTPVVFVPSSNRVLACRSVVHDGGSALFDLQAGVGQDVIACTANAGRLLRQLEALPGSCQVALPAGMKVQCVFPVAVVLVDDPAHPMRPPASARRAGGDS